MSDVRIRFEPLITPFFRAWWRLRRSMTLGVRAIACDEAGRVLLVRHSYSSGWHFPGGGVEAGESALEAAVRELAEEGGAQAEGAPALVGLYSNHANFAKDHVALYRVERWTPCLPAPGGEIAARGFFARDALPEGVTPGTLRRLAEVFDAAPISATW